MYFQALVCDTSGQPQPKDDFQPRANIKKLVKEGNLRLKDEQSIFKIVCKNLHSRRGTCSQYCQYCQCSHTSQEMTGKPEVKEKTQEVKFKLFFFNENLLKT